MMDTGLQFESAADALGDVVFRLTSDGVVLWANEAAANVLGRPRSLLTGCSLFSLLTPASAEVAERAIAHARDGNSFDELSDLEFIRADLMSALLEIRFTALRSRDGLVAVGRADADRNETRNRFRRAQFQSAQFQAALVELATSEFGTLPERLQHLTGVSASILQAARVSVWLFEEGRRELRCAHSFDRERLPHPLELRLEVGRYPKYFEALEQTRAIAVEDVHTHPLTSELPPGLATLANTTSILDVPIHWNGGTVGVLCHEHTGEQRQWNPEERSFAASVADLTALALETARRRRAETEHEKSLAQLQLFFSQSLDGFFFMMLDEPVRWDDSVDKERTLEYVLDHERVVKVNDALLHQYQVAPEEIIGSTPRMLFAHAPEEGRKLWREMLNAGRLHVESDERRSDGSRMWVEGDYICFYDGEGRVTGHFGIQRDITERKLADDALRELNQRIAAHASELENRVAERTAELSSINSRLRDSEERLSGIFQTAMDAIIVIDRNGVISMLNGAAERMLRCTQVQAVGKPVNALLTEELQSFLRTYMADGRREPLWVPEGHCARRFDGEAFPAEISVSRARLSGAMLFTIFLRDVNEKKKAEERLDQLRRQNVYLREAIQREYDFEEIVGASEAMRDVFRNIEMVADTDSTVLLLGETGTGKELIARAVHNRSRRRSNTMIKVNCGALPAGLVESELFGHERGAFTGALMQKKGRFELANRGTIFLDEIGEVPLDTQSKLLRVLQEQEFERVGGSQSIQVDVRVIAATNRDLAEEIKRGTFRADLFYRLHVFPIFVPPLRQRREDIPLLAAYFARKFAERMGKRVDSISPAVNDRLKEYDWPGNVRELANLVERAVILCQGNTMRLEHIALPAEAAVRSDPRETLPTLEVAERDLIVEALKRTDGMLAGPFGAAELLGINRSTLWSRMRKLGIETPKAKRN